ncbi:twin-arginine translocation signal domain-containing protein [Actinomadura opuntiae]
MSELSRRDLLKISAGVTAG